MGRLVAILALTLNLVACGETTAPTDHTGAYALVSFNGGSLPYYAGDDLHEGEVFRVEVIEGEIVLQAGGNFSDRLTLRYTGDDSSFDFPDILSGNYTVRGQTITFTLATSASWEASLTNGRITIPGMGVYQISD